MLTRATCGIVAALLLTTVAWAEEPSPTVGATASAADSVRDALSSVCATKAGRRERLERLAICFKDAVYTLQSEPGDETPGPRDVQAFLERWVELERIEPRALPAECTWFEETKADDSARQRMPKVELIRSDFQCGLPYFWTTNTYRFSCPKTKDSVEIEVRRGGGGPPIEDM